MKSLVTALMLSLSVLPQDRSDSLLVMFWNLENFFDWKADSTSTSSSDKEFSSFGTRHWTRRKFQAKCNAISKVLFWMADQKGRMPDVIGVAEVENGFVLKRLLASTQLWNQGYKIIHYDSPDPRGIDVALLYKSSSLQPLSSSTVRVGNRDHPFKTRDILTASFKTVSGNQISFLVNHHPSKYGSDSQWKRNVAVFRLRESMDSLHQAGFVNMVAMGDFNDTPDNPAFRLIADDVNYINLSSRLYSKGEGTIKYNGKWDLIDMFFISSEMESFVKPMEIVHVPFLTVRDSAHCGEKPLRTYSGPRYLGGVSDHCPVMLLVTFP